MRVVKRRASTAAYDATMKTLVVYYSRSGHTEQVAREIARRCGADLEPIVDEGIDRSGPWGYLMSAWQALAGATPPIRRATRNPADYDVVVIGTPVWFWSLSAPVRTWLRRHARQLRRVAFFCTEGGSGDKLVFDELRRRCGLEPLATMALRERDLGQPRHAQPLRRFVERLEG